MSGNRADKVADQVRRSLAQSLREELRDPRVAFVTVTDVKLSPDLKNALVFVTVMPPERREDSLAGLTRAVPFLRKSLARHAGLRFTPQIKFVYDETFESGQRLEDILRELRIDEPVENDAEPD